MFIRKPLSVLCGMLLGVSLTAAADVNGDMNNFFNKLGFASNTSQPQVWQGQAAGYASGGSLYARTQVKTIQLVSMTLPDINAGCGGIDAYLGSFSFINSEQLQRFAKQIMSNAAGYFFDLALQTTVPEIKTAKDFLQKMASDINSMNLSSCQAAQGIVGGLFPRTQVAQQKVCQDIAGESNIFSDWAASRQGCSVGGQMDKVQDKASDKDKERVMKNINIMWNALSKNRLFDDNKELKEFVMTLTGTLIFGENSEITPLPARTTDQDLIKAMMEGGTAKIYHCNDSDKCLKVVADASVTISDKKALKNQISALLSSIQNKAVEDVALTEQEKGFISSTTIPVFKYLVDPQMLGVSNSLIYQLTDYIGYDILLQYIQELIQQARAMISTGNYPQSTMDMIMENLNQSAISLLPEETRPRVIGLAPTHRAVGEMQSAGVDARTTASFLHDTQLLQRNGQTPDFSNTLFLLDESSMVGLADMAKAHSLIVAGGGRAVSSGDNDQLQPIAPGQPFRLMQQRSAADVAIMKEIVRQVPELRPAVYSLMERDVHHALTTIEQVTPEQVPRKEGVWAPGSSVVEFTPKQEKAIQKALSEGKTLPAGQPATLYEALVKDYTGRTPEAQSQTLVITHLNKDRRTLNGMIHDARRENGETGKEEITLPVLVTSNIRDGELRKLSTWTAHKEAVALVDNVYHRISKVDKANQLITLTDSDGKERYISPREASAEGVTLYRQEKITVSQGDRMRFSKSDPERGYVANSIWEVQSVSGDSVTLSDGKLTRTLTPKAEQAQQHIDLAYAITAHGAQGASEPYAIALEGVAGGREQMASFESAYVALSRMKQHVQVYTDSREGWIKAIKHSPEKATAHDILEPRNDRAVKTADLLFGRARPLDETAAGRAALQQSGLAQGSSPGKFISPGKKYPQPHVALPAFDKNGKAAGIWLSPLTDRDGRLEAIGGEGRIMGNEDARFVALQNSRNGESLLAGNMGEGVRMARDNPDTGVVVRLAGDDRPWNPGAITGGRIWAEPAPVAPVPQTGADIILPPEVLAQRAAEEQQRREMEKQAEQTAREVAGEARKAGEPADRVKEVIGDVIRGLERDRPGTEKTTLPDDPQFRRQEEAIQQVASERLQRERLQAVERDMVRDLNREKTLGGD